jgi:hypothetical protein
MIVSNILVWKRRDDRVFETVLFDAEAFAELCKTFARGARPLLCSCPCRPFGVISWAVTATLQRHFMNSYRSSFEELMYCVCLKTPSTPTTSTALCLQLESGEYRLKSFSYLAQRTMVIEAANQVHCGCLGRHFINPAAEKKRWCNTQELLSLRRVEMTEVVANRRSLTNVPDTEDELALIERKFLGDFLRYMSITLCLDHLVC